jgi:queuine tRNA-ribosyltransferase
MAHFGGIHRFMNWDRAVLTDSGGFQIFSLSRQLKITEEGAVFKSYIDGREIHLTPEQSIGMQRVIGSDIMMVLDQCIDSTSGEALAREALERTTRWAKRSLIARGDSNQALFGIVQGACFPKLRKESADRIIEIGFDGYALGGLAVGETKAEREEIVEIAAPLLPSDRPRYLMGVGTPIDLLEAVKRGMDMFDCILPTSLAHQGVCFTSDGKIDLRRSKYRTADEALDPNCPCETCKRHPRGYLHHLIKSDEFVADQHLSLHNLTFYRSLMTRMRESILQGSFRSFYAEEQPVLLRTDAPEGVVRPTPRVDRIPTLGDYEVVKHPDGYGSIRQISSGETMHSVVDPAIEARALYVDQPAILETVGMPGEELVIWDLGLGAATNAMVAIQAIETLPEVRRSVSIVSFESDLDSLRLALKHPEFFKHLRHGAPHALLRDGKWRSESHPIAWQLRQGDLRLEIPKAAPPAVIWFDPFSYRVDSELWQEKFFRELRGLCTTGVAQLVTYSSSTAVRAALLAAGWWVGAGVGTGPKRETTTAYSSQPVQQSSLLGAEWLQRWERSDAKCPMGSELEAVLELVRGHPQFRGMAG